MITQEQEEFIIKNYYSMTNKEIGDVIRISPDLVSHYGRKNGLKKDRNHNRLLKLTDEQKEFIKQNCETMTSREIGDIVGYTRKQIQGWIDHHCKDRKRKIRQFNDRYFESIDTPEKAYWLGFIYADGWISIHKHDQESDRLTYEFGMQLQRQDEYMLDSLNMALGGKHIVKQLDHKKRILNNKAITETQSSVLRVYSKSFVLDLLNNGIAQRKTKSDVFPIVDDQYFLDFLRGYIDGDGCIHQIKNGILGVHITGANKYIFEYLQQKLLNDYNISTKIYSEEFDEWRTKYRLYCFRQDDVKRLLDLIYYDPSIIKLERKYQKYIDFYGLAA